MASVRKEIETDARPEDVWAAIRDIGALHTRLVPGFVIATRVEPDARVVTFGNGMEIREPIVDLDDVARRLVWSAEGAGTTHYNASVQVFEGTGPRQSRRVDCRLFAARPQGPNRGDDGTRYGRNEENPG